MRVITARHGRLECSAQRSRNRLRKMTIEPVFGQIRQASGFRQFLLRGRRKVSLEWALICMAHNLNKLHGSRSGHPA